MQKNVYTAVVIVIVYLHQTSRHKIKLENFTLNRRPYIYSRQYEYIFVSKAIKIDAFAVNIENIWT